MLAAIRDREVVKKILRHLKLPEMAPIILPAREVAQLALPFQASRASSVVELEREVQEEGPVAVELLPEWMRELPRPTRARRRERGRSRRPSFESQDLDETPNMERLPTWMRAVPEAELLLRRRAGEPGLVDEVPRMERLPAWMRTPRPRRPIAAHWDAPARVEESFYPDESPEMEQLPAWMRTGRPYGPAPPEASAGESVEVFPGDSWDCIDPLSPADFADPIYEEAPAGEGW